MVARIAVLTGVLAYETLKLYAERASKAHGVDVEVFKLPISVMGLATVDTIAQAVESSEVRKRLEEFDLVLVSGLVRGDTSSLEKALGKPVYKGSADPSLLPEVVGFVLSGGELSRTKPAEDVLGSSAVEKLLNVLRDLSERAGIAFEVGSVKVPLRGPPVLLAAETPTELPVSELREAARAYEEAGASIVVVGATVEEGPEECAKKVREALEGVSRAAVGVDALKPSSLSAGLETGAEVAFSLHSGNIEKLTKWRKEKAFVVVPCEPTACELPRDFRSSAELLKHAVRSARRAGYEKVLADLVVNPPCLGLSSSIAGYVELASSLPDTPLVMGFANVIELMDADSTGALLLLSSVAVEVGASVALVTEDSWKTRGCVREAALALVMSSVAKVKGTPPINLGVDLLLLKGKAPQRPAQPLERVEDVPSQGAPEAALEEPAYFKIEVDHVEGKIVVCAYTPSASKPEKCYRGEGALQLLRRILVDFPGISKSHAGYLGAELSKAEVALATGKRYVQDEPLDFSVGKRLRAIGL